MLFSALDLLGKAGELMAVLLEGAQIAEPRVIRGADALAGHYDRNAGRIGNDTDGDHPVCHLA